MRGICVEGVSISCESCERIWTLASHFSVYEQQAIESRPCPHCAAYTLTCRDEGQLVAAESRRWAPLAV